MFSRLIIDGNSVYEIDEECLKRRSVPPECGVTEAIERQQKKENKEKSFRWIKQQKGNAGRIPFLHETVLEDSATSVSTAVIATAEEKKEDQPAAVVSATAVVIAAEGAVSTAG